MINKCIICEIINEKRERFVVYEDESFISFLDSRPLFWGHCLLSPKKHYCTLYDLPLGDGQGLLNATQKVGRAITHAMQAQGTFIAMNNIVSQSIDHLHLHIVPRNRGDALKGFFWPRTQYRDVAHMLEVQSAIKNALEK